MAFVQKYLSSEPDTTYSRKARYSHPTDTLANMLAANYFTGDAWVALPKGCVVTLVAETASTPKGLMAVVTVAGSASTAPTLVAFQTSATPPG